MKKGVMQGKTRRIKEGFTRLLLYYFLIIVSLVYIFPFLYMMITSVKSYSDLRDVSVNWIPHSLCFKNYYTAWQYLGFWKHFLNSLVITGLTTLGHCLVGAFIAYGFARFNFKGKNFLFLFVILSILFPPQVMILPQYFFYSSLGWDNTALPIIVPTFFGYGLRGGLFIFIFRQFFKTIPRSLEEAAQLDGYGSFRIFFRIVLPIASSVLLVSVVLSSVWHWNDYYEPAIYISNAKYMPLSAMMPSILGGIRDYFEAEAQGILDMLVTDGVVMAGVVIIMLPIFILFGFLQKQFMVGIERTGLVE